MIGTLRCSTARKAARRQPSDIHGSDNDIDRTRFEDDVRHAPDAQRLPTPSKYDHRLYRLSTERFAPIRIAIDDRHHA